MALFWLLFYGSLAPDRVRAVNLPLTLKIAPGQVGPIATFRGRYVAGFELNSFFPYWRSCDEWGDLITVDFPDGSDVMTRIDEVSGPFISRMHSQHVDLVLRGWLSPPGHYGHLGKYDRELIVSEVLDVKKAPKCG